MIKKYKNYILLHLTVLIWGFTGIIGRFLKDSTDPVISSVDIVWNRMFIAALFLLAILFYTVYIRKNREGKTWGIKTYATVAVVGILISTHWITFFEAIHLSNVSIALVCMSTSTFFVSLIEPIVFKKKFEVVESIMGLAAMLGVGFIFNGVSSEYYSAIYLGVFSAFVAATFSVLNGKLVRNHDALKLSSLEMLSGAIGITIYFYFSAGKLPEVFTSFEFDYMLAIILLGTVCTAWAFLVATKIMKELSPFTVNLAVNMEPIYAILMALIFFSESEKMSPRFYLGASIVIGVVMLNGVVKGKINKRKQRKKFH